MRMLRREASWFCSRSCRVASVCQGAQGLTTTGSAKRRRRLEAATAPQSVECKRKCRCKCKWGSEVAVAGRHCHLDSLTQKPHLHWDTLSTTSTQEPPTLSCLGNPSQRNRHPNTRQYIHPLDLLKTEHGGLRGAQGQLVRGRRPRRRPAQLERLAFFAHGQSQASAGACCDSNWC